MKIYVGNLPKQITDKQLHDLAAPFGKPDSAHVARWVAGGASKGFGFVEFRTAEEAQTAIAGLHGKVIEEHSDNEAVDPTKIIDACSLKR